MSTASLVLARIDAIESKLAQVQTVDDAKQFIALAAAAREYAEQFRNQIPMEQLRRIDEAKAHGERKLGELLAAMEKNRGAKGIGPIAVVRNNHNTPTLKSLGISKELSVRAQAFSSVPSKQFDRELKSMEVVSLPRLFKRIRNAARREPPRPKDSTAVSLESLISAGHKFGCIYADPPWSYGNQATRASTDNHYGTMSVDDICALPVGDLADDVAYLHLWTTNAFLFEAAKVIEAWGFTYKSVLVWVKPQMGIGNYWRVSHEFLLLGVRGARTFPDGMKNFKSWMEVKRGEHSAKPAVFRDLIEKVSPGPYLELFGRKTSPNWTVWGNQVERSLYDRA